MCIEFGKENLNQDDITGKSVIEVGSYNVNGSLRTLVKSFNPSEYIGVDITAGPSVDVVCDADNIVSYFKNKKFDLLISTEMLEHVYDWREIISNFKRILKPNGVLLITTRSKGHPYHGWPYDYWRYEEIDIKKIFSDFKIEKIEKDPLSPGIFVKARKPQIFFEKNLEDYRVYSIIKNEYTDINKLDNLLFKIKYIIKRFIIYFLPNQVKVMIKKKLKKE